MASSTQYDEAIARAKAALESYSAEAEELAKLYETARRNAQAQYEAQKKESAAQAAEQKRQAGIETRLTERNYEQRLASRGLALSGENAQTSLDLLVALRNQLAGIDSDRQSRDAALDVDLANRQHELDLSYAKQRADSAEKRADLASELASAEANRESAIAAQKAADAAAKAASGSKEEAETGKGLADFLAEKGLSAAAADPKGFGQTLGRATGNTVGSLSGKSASADGVLFGKGYDPEVKAATLAKQIVSSAGGNGKGLTLPQQSAVKELLDKVLANYRLSDDYETELLFNLQSMGYDPETAATADRVTADLREKAEHAYEVCYRTAYSLYRHSGYSGEEVAARAERTARDNQLRYLYEHSLDEGQFEFVAGELGLSDALEAFYRQAKKQGLRLGSARK